MAEKDFVERGVTEQQAFIDRAIEQIHRQIDIEILAELSGGDGAVDHRMHLGAAWTQQMLAIGLADFGIELRLADDRGDDAALGAAEQGDQLADAQDDLVFRIGTSRDMDVGLGQFEQGLHHDRGFAGPPAIDCGLAGACFLRDGVDRHFGEPVTGQQQIGSRQYFLAATLAARTTGGACRQGRVCCGE